MRKSDLIGAAITLCLAAAWSVPVGAACTSAGETVTLTVNYENKTIVADKDPVTIYRGSGEQVCWKVEGLKSTHELRIRPKESTENPNLLPARSLSFTQKEKDSGAPTGAGSWAYKMSVTYRGGAVFPPVDPIVIIDDGTRPGGG